MPRLNFETTALVPRRSTSSWVGNQGKEKTCYAHATTRLITRLIKVRFYPHFIENNVSLDEYYNTTKCGSVNKSIFQCILDAETYPRFNSPIQWEAESISALLFHYIYTCIIKQFGCDGGNPALATDYILKLFYTEITVKDIKTNLNYVRLFALQFSEKHQTMFNTLIKKLAAIFKDIRNSLVSKLFRPKLFSSNNLSTFTLFKNETNSSQMPQAKLALVNESIKSGYYYTDTLDTIKSVISNGFYVLLGIYNHAVLISGIDSIDDSLIIKNSWGDNSSNWAIEQYKLVENNRLQWSTLQAYLDNPPQEDTSSIKLVFVIPNEMIASKPLNVMVTSLSKHVPIFSRFSRFSRFFGKGRKPKNKKHTKKYTKPKKAKKPKTPTKPRKVTQKLTQS